MACARGSKTKANRRGDSRHPCHVPCEMGKVGDLKSAYFT